MPKTLEELEGSVQPDPKKHWILPGAIRAGVKVILNGKQHAGKNLIAAELAVSATTYTKFMGCIQPWIVAKTLYITGDAYQTTNNIRRILTGRGVYKSPEDLYIMTTTERKTGFDFWHELQEAIVDLGIKLLVVDRDVDCYEYPSDLQIMKHQTQQFANRGVTTFICTHNAKEWETWRDVELLLKLDNVRQEMHLTTPARENDDPILRTHPVFEKDVIRFDPLPNCETNKLEAEVWKALHHLVTATEGDIRKKIGQKNDKLVHDALVSLAEKGVVMFERQNKVIPGRSSKQVRIWSIRPMEMGFI